MRFPLQKILVASALAVTGTVSSGEPGEAPAKAFDASDYLKAQQFEEDKKQAALEILPTVVVIGGVPYLKLESHLGTIYLPKVNSLSEEELDRALCANSFKETDLNSATAAAAELNVAESVKVYTKYIVDVIHTRCDGSLTRPAPQPITGKGVEIGVKVKTGRGRDPASYSIYNQNLAPNIGVRADF